MGIAQPTLDDDGEGSTDCHDREEFFESYYQYVFRWTMHVLIVVLKVDGKQGWPGRVQQS